MSVPIHRSTMRKERWSLQRLWNHRLSSFPETTFIQFSYTYDELLEIAEQFFLEMEAEDYLIGCEVDPDLLYILMEDAEILDTEDDDEIDYDGDIDAFAFSSEG